MYTTIRWIHTPGQANTYQAHFRVASNEVKHLLTLNLLTMHRLSKGHHVCGIVYGEV